MTLHSFTRGRAHLASSRSVADIPPEDARLLASLIDAAGLRVALIGGHAVNTWHIPRLTEDYDFVVLADRAAIEALVAGLAREGFVTIRSQDSGESSGPDFVRMQQPETGLAVDMLVAKTSLQDRLLERARSVSKLPFPVATPEDLILLKVIANRSHDQVDAMNLARRAGIDWAYIEAEAPTWGMEDRVRVLREQAALADS